MCGIFGKTNFNNRPIDPDVVERALSVMVHRGPDDMGTHFSSSTGWNVALGHRRLSIIDLAGGHQPLSNEDGKVWVVFNGQIYNFKELRKELEAQGHRFRTNCDTEVLVHAYEEHGTGFLEKLNGMFALALWDERKKLLFLARDRLGIKPLYYSKLKEGFIFASEVKALLQDPEVKREIDVESLSMYLTLNYILSPHSMVKGISKLPPGHALIVNEGGYRLWQYWDIEIDNKLQLKEEQYCERIRSLLETAVRRRLMSDVPLGAFLSGGIDSTAVVSYMSSSTNKAPQTFSIGFEEKSYSELPHARYAAQYLGTEHHDLVVEPKIETTLPRLIWYNDEPLGDSSCIPMYFLAQLARKYVKVALSGDGGDENFAGYDTYIADKLATLYKLLPRLLRSNCIARPVNMLPHSLSKVSYSYKLNQFVRGADFSPEKAHYFWRVIFTEEEKEKLFSPDCLRSIKSLDTFDYFRQYFNKYPKADLLDRCLYVDFKTWLVDDILTKVDRASMAHSLEVRVPFLDHELVEFAMRIPSYYKLKGLSSKYILKRALRGQVSARTLSRKKEGFNSPLSYWLKKELKELALENLAYKKIEELGFFNPLYVKQVLDEYFLGRKDNSLKIWGLLNLVMWHEQFMQVTAPKLPPPPVIIKTDVSSLV
ncbi:MAG TPA: asparagine synthase (glutamine-hydrolyzing) [Candidatus Hypogeohydataceae bacterium YC38]